LHLKYPKIPYLPNYHALYVFGDSLSDTGNDLAITRAIGFNPAIPPSDTPHRTYFQGRFSNGPVAVEYLWRLLQRDNTAALVPIVRTTTLPHKTAVNFAFGGSTSGYVSQIPAGIPVPGVLSQVQLFRLALHGRKPKPHGLYVVWTGANDYILADVRDPAAVVANIAQAIRTLYALGARDFLVPNLPDMGLARSFSRCLQGPARPAPRLRLATTRYRRKRFAGLAPQLKGATITPVDIFTIARQNVGNGIAFPPALEVLAPGASGCLIINPSRALTSILPRRYHRFSSGTYNTRRPWCTAFSDKPCLRRLRGRNSLTGRKLAAARRSCRLSCSVPLR